jgi:hypothetical protein
VGDGVVTAAVGIGVGVGGSEDPTGERDASTHWLGNCEERPPATSGGVAVEEAAGSCEAAATEGLSEGRPDGEPARDLSKAAAADGLGVDEPAIADSLRAAEFHSNAATARTTTASTIWDDGESRCMALLPCCVALASLAPKRSGYSHAFCRLSIPESHGVPPATSGRR